MEIDELLGRLAAKPTVQIRVIQRRGLGFVVRIAENQGPVTVTRRGKPVVAVIATADMEALREARVLKIQIADLL